MTISNIALIFLPIAIACGQNVEDPPTAHSPVKLSAVNDPRTGRTAFSFQGRQEPPVIRSNPGGSISDVTLPSLEKTVPDFTVTFTEDKQGFYINGKRYGSEDAPMTRVRVGAIQHWRIVNKTHEVHPFHIHQVHLLFYATNDQPEPQSEWLDTVNVPAEGSVDLIMDFTDPIIRGMSLFHCHLLIHEDKGMMAKILFY